MFDKLIESNSQSAEFKGRGRYFAVSTFLMGALFLAFVLVSIYAADIDIGSSQLDVAQIVAPVETNAPEPEQPRQPERQQQTNQRSTDLPMRRAVVERIDVPPKQILPVSSVPSEYKERPYGRFDIGARDIDPPGYPGGPVGTGGGTSSNTSPSDGSGGRVAAREPEPEPPPIKRSEPAKNTVVSLGPVNGKAKELPKPGYPETARMVRAEGPVQIQITIEKDGSVISAKAINGHPLLRGAAERAARSAKFTPTLLSNEPVRATGIITYNFKLNQ